MRPPTARRGAGARPTTPRRPGPRSRRLRAHQRAARGMRVCGMRAALRSPRHRRGRNPARTSTSAQECTSRAAPARAAREPGLAGGCPSPEHPLQARAQSSRTASAPVTTHHHIISKSGPHEQNIMGLVSRPSLLPLLPWGPLRRGDCCGRQRLLGRDRRLLEVHLPAARPAAGSAPACQEAVPPGEESAMSPATTRGRGCAARGGGRAEDGAAAGAGRVAAGCPQAHPAPRPCAACGAGP